MSREQDWKWLTSTCSTAIRQQHDIVVQRVNLCNYLDDDYNSTYTRYTFLKSCSILSRIGSFKKLGNNTYLLIMTPTLVRFTPPSHANEIFKNFLVKTHPCKVENYISPLDGFWIVWVLRDRYYHGCFMLEYKSYHLRSKGLGK